MSCFGNDLLDRTPKTQATKEKIDKLDLKVLKFCASRDTLNRVKRQPTGWRKYSHILYLIRDRYPEAIENS